MRGEFRNVVQSEPIRRWAHEEWRVYRVAFILIAIFLLATATGIGDGGYSNGINADSRAQSYTTISEDGM